MRRLWDWLCGRGKARQGRTALIFFNIGAWSSGIYPVQRLDSGLYVASRFLPSDTGMSRLLPEGRLVGHASDRFWLPGDGWTTQELAALDMLPLMLVADKIRQEIDAA